MFIQEFPVTPAHSCTLSLIKYVKHTLSPSKWCTSCSSVPPNRPTTEPGPYSSESPIPGSLKLQFRWRPTDASKSYHCFLEFPSRCGGVRRLQMTETPLKTDVHRWRTSCGWISAHSLSWLKVS